MGICKNCIYWGVYQPSICDYVNSQYSSNPKTGMEIIADADDDQGLFVMLQTAPEFGCVNFKSKDN